MAFVAGKDKSCSQCGMKAVSPQSERESTEISHMVARLKALAVESRTLNTEKHHERTWRNFSTYMTSVIGREPTDANPYHCVGYIMSLDDKGTEILHEVACPAANSSTKKQRRCNCPLRAKASSIDTNIGWLSACFRALAMSGEYDPRTCSGKWQPVQVSCCQVLPRCHGERTTEERCSPTAGTRLRWYCLQPHGRLLPAASW